MARNKADSVHAGSLTDTGGARLLTETNPCRPIRVNGIMVPTEPVYMPNFPITLHGIKQNYVCKISESASTTDASTMSTSKSTMTSVSATSNPTSTMIDSTPTPDATTMSASKSQMTSVSPTSTSNLTSTMIESASTTDATITSTSKSKMTSVSPRSTSNPTSTMIESNSTTDATTMSTSKSKMTSVSPRSTSNPTSTMIDSTTTPDATTMSASKSIMTSVSPRSTSNPTSTMIESTPTTDASTMFTYQSIMTSVSPRATSNPTSTMIDSTPTTDESTMSTSNSIMTSVSPGSTFNPTSTTASSPPQDCSEIQASGVNISGVYSIYPDGNGDALEVYCDMDTDGGGWTVFQRREDGSVDFFLKWADYKMGFGNVSGEHWLGNDNIHRLSTQKTYELRVDLEDFAGKTRFASYSSFKIADETDKYRLTIGDYSGNAGNSLSTHRGCRFSTKDSDSDFISNYNCAFNHTGAWWYRWCLTSNLNGKYLKGKTYRGGVGVTWDSWRGASYSLKKADMKIRPTYKTPIY